MNLVPATHAKAIVSALVGALIAAGSALITALQGEHTGFGTITASQWVTVVVAFLIGLGITGGATARVANAPARGSQAAPDAPAAADAPAY
jgi:hypothetical protein